MTNSGGKFDKTKIIVTLPPKRTPREWRELTALKLRQYEMISFQMLIRKGGTGRGTYGE